MKKKRLLAVEMEAAGLYAFADAREKPVICFAHVTNQMARIEGDFEKGEADSAVDALAVIITAARACSNFEFVTAVHASKRRMHSDYLGPPPCCRQFRIFAGNQISRRSGRSSESLKVGTPVALVAWRKYPC